MSMIFNYIQREILRSEKDLAVEYNQAYLLACSDEGEIAIFPCKLLAPSRYPKSEKELEDCDERQHFVIDEQNWNENWETVPEFAQQYEVAPKNMRQ